MFIHKDTTFLFGLVVEYIVVYFGLFVGANKLTVMFTTFWWGQLRGHTNTGSLYIKTTSEECLNLPSLLPDLYLHLGFTITFSVTPRHVPGLELFTSLSVFINFFNKSATTVTLSLHLQSSGL